MMQEGRKEESKEGRGITRRSKITFTYGAR